MASFSKLVITDTGKNLLNDAFALGEKVNFTNASVSEISYQEEELQALCQLPEIKQTVSIHNITRDEDIIEMMVEFDNDDLAAGYYLRTLGIYANIGGGEEVLFAVAKEKTENLFVPAGEVAVSGVNMKLKIQLENADIVQLVVDRASVATLGDILMVRDELSMHFQDRNNPHGVTKSQVGLGNVDNTADTEKPVSAAQQTALNSYYQQSTGYTDQKIADLINGAPETLDTLKEVADAIQENETVVEALDAAIGKKADQAELDGHIDNDTIHITAAERESWNKVTQIEDDIDNLNSGLSEESAKVGLLTSLTTSVKTSIVNAINSLVTALNAHKTSGDHDSRYYTETEIDTKINYASTTFTSSYITTCRVTRQGNGMKRLRLVGAKVALTASTAYTIGTLPAGYLPQTGYQGFVVIAASASTAVYARLEMTVDGTVSLTPYSARTAGAQILVDVTYD